MNGRIRLAESVGQLGRSVDGCFRASRGNRAADLVLSAGVAHTQHGWKAIFQTYDRGRDRRLPAGGIGAQPGAGGVRSVRAVGQSGALHFLAARTTGDPLGVAAAIEAILHRVDPNVPVANVRTMESRLSDSVTQRRLIMPLLGGFAVLALLVAVVGIDGVMGYRVGQRRTELGVRAAIGATASGLVRMIVAEGMRMTVAGVAIGQVLAVGLPRAIAAQLYDVELIDAVLYALATMLHVAVAALACSVPAIRAVRFDAAARR